MMFPFPSQKGSRLVKILGALALIGIFLAVGRIVLRVFLEDEAEPEDSHNGI